MAAVQPHFDLAGQIPKLWSSQFDHHQKNSIARWRANRKRANDAIAVAQDIVAS